jgi:hypothetical protein
MIQGHLGTRLRPMIERRLQALRYGGQGPFSDTA